MFSYRCFTLHPHSNVNQKHQCNSATVIRWHVTTRKSAYYYHISQQESMDLNMDLFLKCMKLRQLKLTNLLLKVLWNVHLKKKRKGKKSLHPMFLHFPFFSSISRISIFSVFFLRKLKETKQVLPLQNVSSVYILQPTRILFTNHTKEQQ